MNTPNPNSDDATKASFITRWWRTRASKLESIDLYGDLGFDDFLYRAIARKQDPGTQLVFLEWMLARLIGTPDKCTRRVPLDHAELRFPDSYLIKLQDLPDPSVEEHYTLCRTRKRIDRSLSSWQAWCPSNWEYFLFTQRELDDAGVFKSMTLKKFLRRAGAMTASEFRSVARARLGLMP